MTGLRIFNFALLCFTTSSVLAALPDLEPRRPASFEAVRAYFIADDQYLVATKADGTDEVRICPGHYIDRARGPMCRVLDPDGLNHFLGGTVTGETFTLDETVKRLSGGTGTFQQMTRMGRDNPGFLLSITYPPTAGPYMQDSLEEIAVASPTEADLAGQSHAMLLLAVGVGLAVLFAAGIVGRAWWESRRDAARRASLNDLIEVHATAARARSAAPQMRRGPVPLSQLAAERASIKRSERIDPPSVEHAPSTAKPDIEEAQVGRKLFLD